MPFWSKGKQPKKLDPDKYIPRSQRRMARVDEETQRLVRLANQDRLNTRALTYISNRLREFAREQQDEVVPQSALEGHKASYFQIMDIQARKAEDLLTTGGENLDAIFAEEQEFQRQTREDSRSMEQQFQQKWGMPIPGGLASAARDTDIHGGSEDLLWQDTMVMSSKGEDTRLRQEGGPGDPDSLTVPDAEYPQIVRELLDLQMGHVPLDAQPQRISYSDYDLIPLAAMAKLIVRLQGYSVRHESALYAFHEALLNFAVSRLKMLEYQERSFLIRATDVDDKYVSQVVNPEALANDESAGQSLFRTTTGVLSQFHGIEVLRNLGVSADHLRALGKNDLANRMDATRPQDSPFSPHENPAVGGVSTFPLQELPVPDYPELVRFVMAACFYDDVFADRLPEYGVDMDALEDGNAANHSLQQLRLLKVGSPGFAFTHEAIRDYANRRMYRIYLQLEGAATNNPEEKRQFASQITELEPEEHAAFIRLQMALTDFSNHFGAQSLQTIGLESAILAALGLESLAKAGGAVPTNGDSTSEGASALPLPSLPLLDYPEAVRAAMAACFYTDVLADRLTDYGVDKRVLDNRELQHQSLQRLWRVEDVSPEFAATHGAIRDYVGQRTFRIYLQLERSSADDPDQRRELTQQLQVVEQAEAVAHSALKSELGTFADRFGAQSLRTIGLEPPILVALELSNLIAEDRGAQSK